MENDDRQVGRVLSRREVLALFGTAGAAILAGCVPGLSGSEQLASEPTQAVPSGSANMPTTVSTLEALAATSTEALANTGTLPACVVRPEMTEGPYFVDEMLNRSDIRSDPSTGEVKEGLPLQITMRVSQVGDACAPLEGAQVDIWHCDAMGIYSDTTDPGFNTVGQKFLRGYQVTDANGVAQFTTIYPGWYQGRTVHIHFKIRTDPNSEVGGEFTSQLFFDDSLTDQVHAQEPYASKRQRTLRNEGDGIFRNGGDQLLLQLTQADEGYATTFDIGLQMT